MNQELKITDEPVGQLELALVAAACLDALERLGYIDPGQRTPWTLDFGDVCEERGLMGATGPDTDGMLAILINRKISRRKVLETIAHEAVHLIQYMKGDAKRIGPEVLEWKGKPHQLMLTDGPGYDDQPWEEEAFRLAPEVVAYLYREARDKVADFQ